MGCAFCGELMSNTLTREEELLCFYAALPAGHVAARPLFQRILNSPWPAAVGWGVLALLIGMAAITFWGVILSLSYEHSRLPLAKKRVIVLLFGPAIPVAGFFVGSFLINGVPPLNQVFVAAGLFIAWSLAMSLLVWGSWRFVLWVERQRKRKLS